MRPITPIVLQDATPADLAGMAQPDFDIVPPADLYIEDEYQRALSQKSMALIAKIVANFRWSKFRPPICVRVDGKLHVIDGQHTAIAAATHPEISIIPVIVVDEPKMRDRAAAFVSHARDRVQPTVAQVHRAEIAAGDARAMAVQNVCNRAHVILRQFPPPSGQAYAPGETVALSAIKGLIGRQGEPTAERILAALSKAGVAPITSDLIKAAEALMCEPDYSDEFDTDRLAATIQALPTASYNEAKTLAAAKSIPFWRALIPVIYRNRRGKAPSPKKASVQARCAPPEPAKYDSGDPAPGRSALDEKQRVQGKA